MQCIWRRSPKIRVLPARTQDTGIGMTHDEVVESLGTIARSGSKEFLRKLTEAGDTPASSIIGQFGVGFYSCFMVADRVEVFTRSRLPDARAVRWSSDGSGVYEVSEAEGVEHGTKIVLHLKPDCADFADEEAVSKVVQKYSNFVGSPVFLNGRRANTLQVGLGCCVTNTLLLFRLLASERYAQSGFSPH